MRIALAPGDGIGPEIMNATLELLKAAGGSQAIEFVPVEMGKHCFDRGETRGMTNAAIETVEACGLLLKGPMETPKGGGGKSINVTARKMWNAFANLRHFRTLPGVMTPYSRSGVSVDFFIVRENIEDTYGGIEHRLSNDVVQCKRLISAPGSDAVHRFAFETARRMGIRKVHCGHKANIMKMTDGLFLERFKAVAADYPEIETADVIVDALCMNLVMKPQQYRMIVLPNLQGDIVSDLAAGLVGGLGFAPSANIGNHISIFEAVHGTAPDIAGKGIANPCSLILSTIMLLRHVGMMGTAARLENALLASLEQGVRTGDFGDAAKPALGTMDFVREVAQRLGQKPSLITAVPDAEDRVTFKAPVKPFSAAAVHTFGPGKTEVVGADVYLDAAEGCQELAKHLQEVSQGTPFRLKLISNRGTQVWPTGSVYTDCVDYWRARFERVDGAIVAQPQTIDLLQRVAARYTVCSYELLRTFDGKPGFSMAQGQ
ncbi:MAG: isocitrate/isopropylmalate family dehydrogenase [Phycisphaerales bacterium]